MVEAPMVKRESSGIPRGTEPQEGAEVLTPSLHGQHQQGCREEHLTSQVPERALGLRQTRPGKGQRGGQESAGRGSTDR